jgi:penicillin-binding protein 1A
LFKVGDLIDVKIVKAEQIGKRGLARADADSARALLAIDNRTGQIRAMVGGFNFEKSKFNRATRRRGR